MSQPVKSLPLKSLMWLAGVMIFCAKPDGTNASVIEHKSTVDSVPGK